MATSASDSPFPTPCEWRVLVYAPTGSDARLTVELVQLAGIQAEAMPDIATLHAEVARGCGAILLGEEALAHAATKELFRTLQEQPAWSDIPVALITSRGIASEERLRRLAAFGAERNVTLLERPFRPGTLVSTLEVALRSRHRQYEVRRLLTELSAARDAAERANRAKDDFLAALSHELRTPLSPVLLLATAATSDPDLPPDIRHDFEVIARNVGLEARLIDDLLDLTRITRGKLSLDLQPVDAHDILGEAIATARSEFDDKRQILETDFCARRSWLNADPVRLQQVLWNVLKNAAKFTPRGGRIRIETEDDTAAQEIRITVTDSGVGMTPEELSRVFDAFAQGDHAKRDSAHHFGGLGLGLAISRMLMELHGGRITATSPGRGLGSSFLVQLKASVAPLPSREITTSAAPGQATLSVLPTHRRVLLVEDHGPTRTTLEQLMKRRGYVVCAAASLQEARRLIATENFDLLLSDLGLPDGNGCELMEEMRAKGQVKGIALSGYGMDLDVAQSRQAGFDTHLVKPVNVQTLEAALSRIETSCVPAG
ncbi:MAG TPA: ATP-binding protein [Lacunisphaera sp.]